MSNRIVKCGPRETWSSGIGIGIEVGTGMVTTFRFTDGDEADINVICVDSHNPHFTLNTYCVAKELKPVVGRSHE